MAWLFYDFVPFEHQKQGYVLLLGWSKTRNTNRKAVWVACFHPDGTVTYNHPLLRKGESRSASLTFEYALDASMLLKQDKNGKRIILLLQIRNMKAILCFMGPMLPVMLWF